MATVKTSDSGRRYVDMDEVVSSRLKKIYAEVDAERPHEFVEHPWSGQGCWHNEMGRECGQPRDDAIHQVAKGCRYCGGLEFHRDGCVIRKPVQDSERVSAESQTAAPAQSEPELKPCPWCKAIPVFTNPKWKDTAEITRRSSCFLETIRDESSGKAGTPLLIVDVDKWNTRASLQEAAPSSVEGEWTDGIKRGREQLASEFLSQLDRCTSTTAAFHLIKSLCRVELGDNFDEDLPPEERRVG